LEVFRHRIALPVSAEWNNIAILKVAALELNDHVPDNNTYYDLSDQMMARSLDGLLGLTPILSENIEAKVRGEAVGLYALSGSSGNMNYHPPRIFRSTFVFFCCGPLKTGYAC
jgi:hypothetical protein